MRNTSHKPLPPFPQSQKFPNHPPLPPQPHQHHQHLLPHQTILLPLQPHRHPQHLLPHQVIPLPSPQQFCNRSHHPALTTSKLNVWRSMKEIQRHLWLVGVEFEPPDNDPYLLQTARGTTILTVRFRLLNLFWPLPCGTHPLFLLPKDFLFLHSIQYIQEVMPLIFSTLICHYIFLLSYPQYLHAMNMRSFGHNYNVLRSPIYQTPYANLSGKKNFKGHQARVYQGHRLARI